MTAKEKAQQLYDEFYDMGHLIETTYAKNHCKKCALFCVDEIIEGIMGCYNVDGALSFYRQVRTEIEKM